MAERARLGEAPIASSTWLGRTLPDEQADPALTQGAVPAPRKLFWRYKANQQRAVRDGEGSDHAGRLDPCGPDTEIERDGLAAFEMELGLLPPFGCLSDRPKAGRHG